MTTGFFREGWGAPFGWRKAFDRQLLVLIHRYLGLVMAGFLAVAGLTGCLLVWNDELDAAISPELFLSALPAPEMRQIDPLVLRAQVAGRYPNTIVNYSSLRLVSGRSIWFILDGADDPLTGQSFEPPNNQIFVSPYTGEVQGERKWGDIGQGMKNLMPFIYRLHYSLAMGAWGMQVFGIVALLWTLDCFVGVCLTFPVSRRKVISPPGASKGNTGKTGWLARWRAAWKVRWQGGGYKVNFDLHRAGSLWLWAMLLVLAWSSVAFNLSGVYNPMMRAVFPHQPGDEAVRTLDTPQAEPGLSWVQARGIGRRLAAEQAQAKGFGVLEETGLSYDPALAVYRYDVRSELDLRDRDGSTRVSFDANTGALLGVWLPTGGASGDTFRTWITSLHMAALWGIPFKLFACVLGLAVAMLSVTGMVIWWKKRQGRLRLAAKHAMNQSPGLGEVKRTGKGAACSD